MAHDVFISYSTKDQKIIEDLSAYLEQNGIRCFIAYRDIPRGVVWAEAITEAIEKCRLMVVVFSEHFNSSKQVDREIEMCSEEGKPILTFRIQNTEFTGAKKYYLKNINWIDAFPNPEGYFGNLLNAVQRLIPDRTADKSAEIKRLAEEKAAAEAKARKEAARLRADGVSTKKPAKPFGKYILLATGAVVFVLLLVFGLRKNDGNNDQTMTITLKPETKGDTVTIRLAGTGTATIDWGDGSPVQTHKLEIYDIKRVHDEGIFQHSHTYFSTSVYTIAITGKNVTYLECSSFVVTNLDVSKNVQLEVLNCSHNKLNNLDVSKNVQLTDLLCVANHLTKLDVSKNVQLEYLECSGNQLSTAALNALFTSLHDKDIEGKSIFIYVNPGEADCQRSIAESKGWIVY